MKILLQIYTIIQRWSFLLIQELQSYKSLSHQLHREIQHIRALQVMISWLNGTLWISKHIKCRIFSLSHHITPFTLWIFSISQHLRTHYMLTQCCKSLNKWFLKPAFLGNVSPWLQNARPAQSLSNTEKVPKKFLAII